MKSESDEVAIWQMLKRGCSVYVKEDGHTMSSKLDRYSPKFIPRVYDLPQTVLAIVSGQNLSKYDDIEKWNDLPILRPLIGYTDEEIRQCYKKI